jgi:phage FluMu protein Com
MIFLTSKIDPLKVYDQCPRCKGIGYVNDNGEWYLTPCAYCGGWGVVDHFLDAVTEHYKPCGYIQIRCKNCRQMFSLSGPSAQNIPSKCEKCGYDGRPPF